MTIRPFVVGDRVVDPAHPERGIGRITDYHNILYIGYGSQYFPNTWGVTVTFPIRILGIIPTTKSFTYLVTNRDNQPKPLINLNRPFKTGEDTMSLNHNFNVGDTVTCNTAPWNTLGIGTITVDDHSDVRPLRVAWPDGKYHWSYPTELTKVAPAPTFQAVQAVEYKKGDIVRHINKPEWGNGEIVTITDTYHRADIDYCAPGQPATRLEANQWYGVRYAGKGDGTWFTAKQHLALVGATPTYPVGAVVIRVGHPERGLGTVTELRTRKPCTKVTWANGKTTWVEDDEVAALPYQKGDSVIRLGDLARGTGVIQNLRTDKTPCVNVHWASGQKTWNELDEIEKGTAPAFKVGDTVQRVGEVQRGPGKVVGYRDSAPRTNVHWDNGRKTWNEDNELTAAPTASSFKVGDKVISTHPLFCDTGVATIVTDDKSDIPYYIQYPSGKRFWLPAIYLQLAPAFQVGDVVKYHGWGTVPTRKGVIVEVDNGKAKIVFPEVTPTTYTFALTDISKIG